jgi:hypothetical protein
MPSPERERANAGVRAISRSPKRIDPDAPDARPASARKVEDFPAPLAPIRQTSSPSATSRSIPFTARMPP